MATQPSVSGVFTTWTVLKGIVVANGVLVHYTEDNKKYNIWCFNGPSLIRTALYKSGIEVAGIDQTQNDIDRTDFETNYKPTANGLEKMAIRIEQNEQIDVTMTGGVSTLTNKYRYDPITTNQSIADDSFTTVYSYSGSGALFGVYLETTWSDMQFTVEVDGVDITSAIEIENIPIAGPGSSGNAGPGAPFINRLSAKEVSMIPPTGITYSTSVVVKLKSANSGKKLVHGFVTLTKVT